jgi:FMN phosphatase YigB (HAD superfamily)
MIDFEPKFITFDCYGTLVNFRMADIDRALALSYFANACPRADGTTSTFRSERSVPCRVPTWPDAARATPMNRRLFVEQ